MASPIQTRHTVGLHFVLCCLLGGSAAVCAAQAYTPPPPPLTTLPPCPVPKDAKEAKRMVKRRDCDPTNRATAPAPAAAASPTPAAKAFPFPGDRAATQPATPAAAPSSANAFPFPGDPAPKAPSAAGARQFPYPRDRDGEYVADPNVPYDPAAEKKAADTPAGKAFPYPGDPAPASPLPATASAPAAPPAGSSSSSSSSSSSDDDDSSASSPAAKRTSDDDDGPPKLADAGSEGKRNRKTVKPQTDDERVDEDLRVASFYGQSGNPMGAYLRAKDAVKTQPDYPEARFVLGEAAKRLKKADEAKAELSEYLKLAPNGEHAKAAEESLSELR